MNRYRPYAKAVAAFVVGTVAILLASFQALPDGAGFGDLDTVAWITIVGGVAAVTGTVFGVSNRE